MNLVAFTRRTLGLSQAEFGRWLAERLGREKPIPYQRVAEWERGERSPRLPIRRVCAPVAARAIAREAVHETAAMFYGSPSMHGFRDQDEMDKALADLVAEAAEKIERLIA